MDLDPSSSEAQSSHRRSVEAARARSRKRRAQRSGSSLFSRNKTPEIHRHVALDEAALEEEALLEEVGPEAGLSQPADTPEDVAQAYGTSAADRLDSIQAADVVTGEGAQAPQPGQFDQPEQPQVSGDGHVPVAVGNALDSGELAAALEPQGIAPASEGLGEPVHDGALTAAQSDTEPSGQTAAAESQESAANDDAPGQSGPAHSLGGKVTKGSSGKGKHSLDAGEASEYSRSVASRRYSARKMSTGKKVGIGVAAAVVAILVIVGVAVGVWYNTIANNIKGQRDITNLATATAGEPYYVLLLGGDSREDSKEDNRTDSIMVARVDEKKKEVNLISVPRDLRVYIDGHGFCKINSAIELGGFESTVQSVNDVLGIQVNYYAFIYFSGFKDLVDKLGGVRVDVPAGTMYRDVWVQAGEDVLIDGKEALVLARCRHGYPPDQGAYAMGDYQRTLNQRNLIKAIAKSVLERDAIEMPGLIESLSQCVETNMSISQIINTAQNMKGFDTETLQAAQMPVAGAEVQGEWFAVMYKDVFEVMDENFISGRELMYNLANFNTELNDNDIGSDYVDEKPYAYTQYERHYGEFKGKKSSKK